MKTEYKEKQGMNKTHHPGLKFREVCQLLGKRAMKERDPLTKKYYTLRSISATTGVPEPTIGNWKRSFVRQIQDLILEGQSHSQIAEKYGIKEEAIPLLINIHTNDALAATEEQMWQIKEIASRLGRTITVEDISATLAQRFIDQLWKMYEEQVAIEKLLNTPANFSIKLDDGRIVVAANVARAIIEIRAGRPYDPSTTARLIKTKRLEYMPHPQGNLYFVESLKKLHLVPSHMAQKEKKQHG